ncbi:MAG: hypothetical protein ACXVW2_03585 [Nocardioidaceae bacterium]
MQVSRVRSLASVGASAVLAVAGVAAFSAPTQAATTYAPAATAAIHPGTMMYTDGAQCTANFVYTDSAGDTFVGYAAHCAGTGSSTDTNGCQTQSLPLGTKVTFSNDGNLASGGTTVGSGTLAYSSWLTEKQDGEADPNTCAYNDLALVKVDPADVGKVNPSVPSFGGPVGVKSETLAAGDKVYSYGNSSLRGGVSQLSPKYGASVGDDTADGGWSHPVYTLTPGIPGDSGSGLMDANGNAIGVLSTVAIAPLAGSNNFGDLGKELAYAQAHSGIAGLSLVPGTEPFAPSF